MHELIKKSVEDSLNLKNNILLNAELIETVSNLIINAYKNKNKVISFGNGGSASDAEHLVCELVGRFKIDRKALPAIALTANSNTITAISNDYGYENLFSRQIEAHCAKGDIVIGISTSGNSENVIRGINKAKELDCITIGLLGKDGGKLRNLCDHAILINSDDTPRIQESHILIIHIICDIVEKSLFKK